MKKESQPFKWTSRWALDIHGWALQTSKLSSKLIGLFLVNQSLCITSDCICLQISKLLLLILSASAFLNDWAFFHAKDFCNTQKEVFAPQLSPEGSTTMENYIYYIRACLEAS